MYDSNYTLVIRCDDQSIWAMGSGEYDRLSHQTLMRVQQARRSDTDYGDGSEKEKESDKIGNPLDIDPPAVWPVDGVFKKGFTRVALLTTQSEGLLMDPRDGGKNINNGEIIINSSPTFVFEIVINAGEAYLKEKNIIFTAGELLESRGRKILDYSSGWNHRVLLLERQ